MLPNLVSVIVISYNSSNYIIDTLDSVYNQSYKNIELIIADDYSNDNSIFICKNWIKDKYHRFKNITIIDSKNNVGIVKNCNRGIEYSKGEYIKIIAADDILLPECILLNYNYAKEKNRKFIFSNMYYFKTKNEPYINNCFLKQINDFINISNNNEKLKYYSRNPFFLNTPTWFISKEILNNFKFNDNFKMIEDQSFIFEILEHNFKIDYLNQYTIMYRKHNNSIQIIKGKDFINDFTKCYKLYRVKYLNYLNIIDIIYIYNFKLFIINQLFYKNKIIKLILYFLNKTNPIKLLNLK